MTPQNIAILIATSAVFGYCLTTLHVPELAASALMSITDNRVVLAILLNVILLFLGMIMDMSPIILITTPILLPVACALIGIARGGNTNFSNTMMSTLPGKKSAIGYNLLHSAFAVGVVLSPP